MSQASRAATTHVHTFGLILEERERDGSPEFRVRLVAGTSLQGYDSSNFQAHHIIPWAYQRKKKKKKHCR